MFFLAVVRNGLDLLNVSSYYQEQWSRGLSSLSPFCSTDGNPTKRALCAPKMLFGQQRTYPNINEQPSIISFCTLRNVGRAAIATGLVAITALRLAAPPVSAADKKVVGATLLSLQYPFLVTLDKAMKAEASKHGIGLQPFDPRQNVSKELDQVENLITKKADLIVMIPVDQKTSQAAAKLINKAGIPLILVNTKFTDDFTTGGGKFASYVGSDDTDAGKIQGQDLVDKLPEGGNVVYLVGEDGGASTERRKTGFESVIKDHPNLKVVTELQAHGSRAEGKTIMENLLQKYGKGQLQGVVAQSDEMALGASSAI